MKRRIFLGALMGAALAIGPAVPPVAASEKGGEIYAKIPTVNVEYWDKDGIFHMVVVDAVVAFHEEAKVDKAVGPLITRALSAMTWEEFSHGNPAATVKAIALDIVRKQPGSEKAVEVLLSRLVIR